MSSTTATSPAASRTASRWEASGGPGSMTTEREPPGSRSTQVLVPSRVMGLALGASTHVPRSPNDPPAQLTVGVPVRNGTE